MTGYVGRDVILRMYWDDQEQPSVECPMSDFFAAGWSDNERSIFDPNFAQLNSAMVAINPNRGMNCFWTMPFRKRAVMTSEKPFRRSARDLLSGQLLADGRPGGRSVLPRPVPQLGRRSNRARTTSYSTACADKATTWARQCTSVSTAPATGGARARSSSSWTATSIQPSAAPAPRTISSARTTGTSAANTAPTTRSTPACTTCARRTTTTIRCAFPCTAGTCRIRSASSAISASPFRPRLVQARRPLQAAPRRHLHRRLLVPDAANRAFPRAARIAGHGDRLRSFPPIRAWSPCAPRAAFARQKPFPATSDMVKARKGSDPLALARSLPVRTARRDGFRGGLRSLFAFFLLFGSGFFQRRPFFIERVERRLGVAVVARERLRRVGIAIDFRIAHPRLHLADARLGIRDGAFRLLQPALQLFGGLLP